MEEGKTIGKKPPLWWVYVYLIFTTLIASGAAIHGIFMVREEARASFSVFFSWSILALIPTIVFSILFWKNQQWYRIGTKILFILWSGTAFWYWSLAPIYQFFFGLLINEVQLGIFLFVYFWEVPIVGGVLFAYVCYRWFKPFQDYFEGKIKPVNPEKFYKELLQYPIKVGVWVFMCSVIAYLLGTAQFIFLQMLLLLKLGKTLRMVLLSQFSSVLVFISLSTSCSTVCERNSKTITLPFIWSAEE
ncbi:MAG: hypothetical protein AAB587_00115 [Patescibacteria group bacterium]